MNNPFRIGATLVAAATLALVAQAAAADTTLTYQSVNGQFTVDIRPGEVRIDDASEQWQLYEQSSQTIFSVQPASRSYTRLDKDVAGTIRERMDSLRAQVESRVQQLPPNKRAAARAALVDQIPGLDTSRRQKIGLDHTGQTDSVAGVECEVVQVVRNGKPAESLCVADADALGISDDSFATVKSMFSLMKTMLSGTGLETVGLPYLDLGGMPVRFTDTASGARRELSGVAHDTLGDDHFDIPSDYIEQAPEQRAG